MDSREGISATCAPVAPNSDWYARHRRLLALLLAVTLFYAFLRGIGFPNLYAATHLLLDYEHGFIKRGLPGAILQTLGLPILLRYSFFFWTSLGLLLLNFALLFQMALRLACSGRPASLASASLYVSSMSIVFLSHTIGYFDHAGLLVTLLVLRVHAPRRQLWIAGVGFSLLLLMHEGQIVIFYPVVFLIILVKHLDDANSRRLTLLLGATLMLMTGLYWVASMPLSAEGAKAMMAKAAVTGYPPREDLFYVHSLSVEDTKELVHRFWSTPGEIEHLQQSWLFTLPLALFFLFLSTRCMLRCRDPKWRMGLMIAAGLSPQVLHFVSYDLDRWNSLTIATSFLLLCTLREREGQRLETAPVAPRRIHLALITIAVVANERLKYPLFDGKNAQSSPFKSHQRYIRDVLDGSAAFPEIPKR